MNTNDRQSGKPRIRFLTPPTMSTDQFSAFVSALASVDSNSDKASLNASSIDDNNGGRVELGIQNSYRK